MFFILLLILPIIQANYIQFNGYCPNSNYTINLNLDICYPISINLSDKYFSCFPGEPYKLLNIDDLLDTPNAIYSIMFTSHDLNNYKLAVYNNTLCQGNYDLKYFDYSNNCFNCILNNNTYLVNRQYIGIPFNNITQISTTSSVYIDVNNDDSSNLYYLLISILTPAIIMICCIGVCMLCALCAIYVLFKNRKFYVLWYGSTNNNYSKLKNDWV